MSENPVPSEIGARILDFQGVTILNFTAPGGPFVRRDGTTTLTAPWPAGNFRIDSQNSTEIFNVKAYGAIGDGIADDTAAIQAAITAAGTASPRGVVYFPKGIYNTNGNYNIDGMHNLVIRGEGIQASLITLTHATNDLFFTTNTPTQDLQFEKFTVRAPTVVRTGGWIFRVNTAWNGAGSADYMRITDVVIKHQMNGFWFAKFQNVWCTRVVGSQWTTIGGIFIKIGQTALGAINQGAGFYLNQCYAQGTNGVYSFTGVATLGFGYWIEDCQGIYLFNSESVRVTESDLKIVSNLAGTEAQNIFLDNMILDTTLNSHCVHITGTGNIARIQFVGGWIGGAGIEAGGSNIANGVKIDAHSIFGIEFVGTRFFNHNGCALYIEPSGPTFCEVNVTGATFQFCGLGAQVNNNGAIYVNHTTGFVGPNITGCRENLSNTFALITSATSNKVYLNNNSFTSPNSFGTPPKGQYYVPLTDDQVISPKVGIGMVPVANFAVAGLAVHANNAAATGAGLGIGNFYRTGADPDTVCVVH